MLPPFGFVAYMLFKDQSTALLAWAPTTKACSEAATLVVAEMMDEDEMNGSIRVEPTNAITLKDTPTGVEVTPTAATP